MVTRHVLSLDGAARWAVPDPCLGAITRDGADLRMTYRLSPGPGAALGAACPSCRGCDRAIGVPSGGPVISQAFPVVDGGSSSEIATVNSLSIGPPASAAIRIMRRTPPFVTGWSGHSAASAWRSCAARMARRWRSCCQINFVVADDGDAFPAGRGPGDGRRGGVAGGVRWLAIVYADDPGRRWIGAPHSCSASPIAAQWPVMTMALSLIESLPTLYVACSVSRAAAWAGPASPILGLYGALSSWFRRPPRPSPPSIATLAPDGGVGRPARSIAQLAPCARDGWPERLDRDRRHGFWSWSCLPVWLLVVASSRDIGRCRSVNAPPAGSALLRPSRVQPATRAMPDSGPSGCCRHAVLVYPVRAGGEPAQAPRHLIRRGCRRSLAATVVNSFFSRPVGRGRASASALPGTLCRLRYPMLLSALLLRWRIVRPRSGSARPDSAALVRRPVRSRHRRRLGGALPVAWCGSFQRSAKAMARFAASPRQLRSAGPGGPVRSCRCLLRDWGWTYVKTHSHICSGAWPLLARRWRPCHAVACPRSAAHEYWQRPPSTCRPALPVRRRRRRRR